MFQTNPAQQITGAYSAKQTFARQYAQENNAEHSADATAEHAPAEKHATLQEYARVAAVAVHAVYPVLQEPAHLEPA
jgi:hypothetical protein